MWFFSFEFIKEFNHANCTYIMHKSVANNIESQLLLKMTTRTPFSASNIFLSTPYKQKINQRKLKLCMKTENGNIRYSTKIMSSMSMGNKNLAPDPTPSDTIHQFYKCMNEKNVKQLGNYISNDCFFEDYSFPKPFIGKKVIHFSLFYSLLIKGKECALMRY